MSGTILVVGDVVNDLVVRTLAPISPKSDTPSSMHRVPGGSGANLAAWLGHLGASVRFAGRVGRDEVADHAAQLERFGVDARLSGDDDLPTATVVVIVSGDGERSMFTDRGANARLSSADLPPELLEGVVHVHVSGYTLFVPAARQAVLDLVAVARDAGASVSVDPGSESFLRSAGPQAFVSWTRGADLCLPNADEAATLTGLEPPLEAARALSRHYGTVVVKLGSRGALVVRHSRAPIEVAAPPADVVDPTGAGDAFCAGFLAARVRGEPDRSCAAAGVRAAAEAITRHGGRPPAGPPAGRAGA
jgi:sugar/nucleoside kinase (ribokinase family)